MKRSTFIRAAGFFAVTDGERGVPSGRDRVRASALGRGPQELGAFFFFLTDQDWQAIYARFDTDFLSGRSSNITLKKSWENFK